MQSPARRLRTTAAKLPRRAAPVYARVTRFAIHKRLGDNPGFSDACLARDAIGFRCVRKPPANQE